MAGSDSHHNRPLNLNSVKSEEDQRTLKLNKQIEELRSELDATKVALKQTKRETEAAQDELEAWKTKTMLSLRSELMAAANALIQCSSKFIGKTREANESKRKSPDYFFSSLNNGNQAATSILDFLNFLKNAAGYRAIMNDLAQIKICDTDEGVTDLKNYDEVQKLALEYISLYNELMKELGVSFPSD